jgi:hypothetical protein
MRLVEFEPTIPVFERRKTVYALDRAASHCDRLQNYLDHKNVYFIFQSTQQFMKVYM